MKIALAALMATAALALTGCSSSPTVTDIPIVDVTATPTVEAPADRSMDIPVASTVTQWAGYEVVKVPVGATKVSLPADTLMTFDSITGSSGPFEVTVLDGDGVVMVLNPGQPVDVPEFTGAVYAATPGTARVHAVNDQADMTVVVEVTAPTVDATVPDPGYTYGLDASTDEGYVYQ